MKAAQHRDPGERLLIVILGLSYANLLIKGSWWIFAATAIITSELWPLFEPLRAFIA